MSQDNKVHSRAIYRKEIDIDGRDYAVDLYEGEIPSLSEGDKEILRDRAGLYNLIVVRKEEDDKKCDKDHHYCHKHGRCERDDHDCDDKPDGHDSDLREISEILKRILSDVEDDRDRDLDRKTLQAVLSLTNTCNTILSVLQNTPPPPPVPIPPPPPPRPPSPSPSPSPSPPPSAPQSHTRVIIQGEVDVPHMEVNEEDKPENSTLQDHIARQVTQHMKDRNPSFKITKVLVARGVGPVAVPW